MSRLLRRIGRRGFREVVQRALPIRSREDLEKVGSEYGGWYVPTTLLGPGAVCYCVGVGEDITFDALLADRFQCEVHAFDPTPRAIAHVENTDTPDGFRFHPVGVWWRDEALRFYAPRNPAHVSHSVKNLWQGEDFFEADCRRVSQLMEQFGHTHLDLLKLDIEGAETEVVANIVEEGVLPRVLCVEFDQPRGLLSSVRRLLRAGYGLAHVDRWNYTFVLRG